MINKQTQHQNLLHPSLKITKNSIQQQKHPNSYTHLEDQTTIDFPKQNQNCKYCAIKQKVIPGHSNKCLTHSLHSTHQQEQEKFRKLQEHKSHQKYKQNFNQSQFGDLQTNIIIRQVNDLHKKIKNMQIGSKTKKNGEYEQKQLISVFKQCINLLTKNFVKANNENNQSFTISLQLDLSNDGSEWLEPTNDNKSRYPHLQLQGLMSQMDDFATQLDIWNLKNAPQLFKKLMINVQQKFQTKHEALREYQISINEMNKKLLSYIQKIPGNNGLKQIEQGLNFIDHISSLGQITSRNFSNSSSLTLRRKLAEDYQLESDFLRFFLLQAIAIERMLPQY